jgi:hypothetical protein
VPDRETLERFESLDLCSTIEGEGLAQPDRAAWKSARDFNAHHDPASVHFRGMNQIARMISGLDAIEPGADLGNPLMRLSLIEYQGVVGKERGGCAVICGSEVVGQGCGKRGEIETGHDRSLWKNWGRTFRPGLVNSCQQPLSHPGTSTLFIFNLVAPEARKRCPGTVKRQKIFAEQVFTWHSHLAEFGRN